MRLAFFGGSFDPPHRGHAAIARGAADAFSLSEVLFAPTGRQPLKPGGAQASFPERLDMVKLAAALDLRFRASNLDGPRPDGVANYTVDALLALRQLRPDAELYSLIGADSFADFARWHEVERLLELARWIVVSRPGSALRSAGELSVASDRIQFLTTVFEDVSATEIRRRLAAGDRCVDVLSAGVSDYIVDRGLYGFPHVG